MRSFGTIAPRLLAPLSLVLIVVVWEVAIRVGHVSPLVMAPPSAIGRALWIELTQGTLLANLMVTLQETAAGFLIAAVLGIGLGSLISEIGWVRRVVLPYLIALQTVPKIAIAPLLVLWFGFGMTSKVIIAAMVAVFPILVNTIEGLGGTDRNRIDMVVAACGSRWQVFRIVKVPSALPFIFAGLNAGIVLALLGAVVGEFIGADAGVGNLIMTANFRMDIATIFAVLVVLGAVGITLNLILTAVQRRVVFWQHPGSGSRRSASGPRTIGGSGIKMLGVGGVVLALGGLILLVRPTPSPDRTLRPVTVAMGHQSIGLGEELYLYAVPKQLGYFREEGLDVTLQPTSGSGAAVQLVVGGRADMGQSNPTTVFNAIRKDADIRLVYNLTPRYASGLAVLADSPIRTPADLSGKIVGVVSLATSRLPEARAMVAAAGLKPDDVRYVAVGTGAQAATSLSSGQVQALYLWDDAYAAIEAQGMRLRIMRDVFPGAADMLDSLQFASGMFLKKDPRAVTGFGRAAAKGVLFTIENPQAALELFYREYPFVRARTEAARRTDLDILRKIMATQEFRNTAARRFGFIPPRNAAFSLRFMTDAGEIRPGVRVDRTYTNAFVAGANDFDPEAVVAFARRYRPR